MVPQFQMYKTMGLSDRSTPDHTALINAFGIFLLCQIMGQIPKDLYESAMIDGYGEFKIFMKIAIPLSKAGIGIQGVLTFMNTWNDFMTAFDLSECGGKVYTAYWPHASSEFL